MISAVINNNEYDIIEFDFETTFNRETNLFKTIHLTFGEPNQSNSNWDEYYKVPITSLSIKEDNTVLYTLNNIVGYLDRTTIQLDNGKIVSKASIILEENAE